MFLILHVYDILFHFSDLGMLRQTFFFLFEWSSLRTLK